MALPILFEAKRVGKSDYNRFERCVCRGVPVSILAIASHQDDQLPILLITGLHGDVPMAVDAAKKGARFSAKTRRSGQAVDINTEDALRQRRFCHCTAAILPQTLQVELIGRSGVDESVLSTAGNNWRKRTLPYGFTVSMALDV